jgi:hypothetical protein
MKIDFPVNILPTCAKVSRLTVKNRDKIASPEQDAVPEIRADVCLHAVDMGIDLQKNRDIFIYC